MGKGVYIPVQILVVEHNFKESVCPLQHYHLFKHKNMLQFSLKFQKYVYILSCGDMLDEETFLEPLFVVDNMGRNSNLPTQNKIFLHGQNVFSFINE